LKSQKRKFGETKWTTFERKRALGSVEGRKKEKVLLMTKGMGTSKSLMGAKMAWGVLLGKKSRDKGEEFLHDFLNVEERRGSFPVLN